MSKLVNSTIKERGKVYGDPYLSHLNIGLTWTALIQQHYGITLDHPIPASLVAQMMCSFKVQRAARVFKDDNYIDLSAYTKFARDFQLKESKQCKSSVQPVTSVTPNQTKEGSLLSAPASVQDVGKS